MLMRCRLCVGGVKKIDGEGAGEIPPLDVHMCVFFSKAADAWFDGFGRVQLQEQGVHHHTKGSMLISPGNCEGVVLLDGVQLVRCRKNANVPIQMYIKHASCFWVHRSK